MMLLIVQCEEVRVPYPNALPAINVTFPITQAGYSNPSDESCEAGTSNGKI